MQHVRFALCYEKWKYMIIHLSNSYKVILKVYSCHYDDLLSRHSYIKPCFQWKNSIGYVHRCLPSTSYWFLLCCVVVQYLLNQLALIGKEDHCHYLICLYCHLALIVTLSPVQSGPIVTISVQLASVWRKMATYLSVINMEGITTFWVVTASHTMETQKRLK